jgi:hypothetical protein
MFQSYQMYWNSWFKMNYRPDLAPVSVLDLHSVVQKGFLWMIL